ncbi:MAG: shikimate kinase [Elusimicrobiota bacterium]
MRILLVGLSCVGKTTIGRLLGGRLGCPFFDLDEEVERHFGTSIQRLQARFLTGYSYRAEVAVVLRRITAQSGNCVIALPPSGLRDAFLRVVRKLDCVTIALGDAPENILARATFYDIDSRPVEKSLTREEKIHCLNDIKQDIAYFNRSYRRADLHVSLAGLDAEAAAERIEVLLARPTPPSRAQAAAGLGKLRPPRSRRRTRRVRKDTGERIYQFRVWLEWESEVWRTVELRDRQTLGYLHRAIQTAYDWGNDHLYAFFLSGKYWDEKTCYVSDRQIGIEAEDGLGSGMRQAESARLDRLRLRRGKLLVYLLDYGRRWRHRIKLLEIAPAQAGEDYPRITEEFGEAPEQYPNLEESGDPRPSERVLLSRLGPAAPLAKKARLELKNAVLQQPSRGRLLRAYRLTTELSAVCGKHKGMTGLLDEFLRDRLRAWLGKLQKNLADEGLIEEASSIGPAWPFLGTAGMLLTGRAQILADAGWVQEARRQVREIEEKFAGDWAPRVLSGKALEAFGDLAAAEALYRRCLKDLETAKEVRNRRYYRHATLRSLISVRRRLGKKAEAGALQASASP